MLDDVALHMADEAMRLTAFSKQMAQRLYNKLT